MTMDDSNNMDMESTSLALPPHPHEDDQGRVVRRRRRMILDSDQEDSSDEEDREQDDDDDDNVENSKNQNRNNARPRPPRPSVMPRKSLAVAARNRHRRRSSARFLRPSMSNSNNSHHGRNSSFGGMMLDGSQNNSSSATSSRGLGELYKKAIRMNAENRINAQNSWNLPLIDNLDKFIEEEEEEGDDEEQGRLGDDNNDTNTTKNKRAPRSRRINFTKASCTLDASVKIYSYRVDDVHLTSYKVLANLHRNDTKKSRGGGRNKEGGDDDGNGQPPLDGNDNDEMGNDDEGTTSKRKKKSSGPTVESNLANININKLDSAFDIDPLFHKMSKTFDEGGAKGLLLVNLGTGSSCNIVFDSSDISNTEPDDGSDSLPNEGEEKDNAETTTIPTNTKEGMIDITDITAKLLSSDEMPLDSLPLVPQLSGLRAQYDELEHEGFVAAATAAGPESRPSRRYAARDVEEKEADRSIHKEALERSARKSMQERSLFLDNDDNDGNSPKYAADDYGGDDDDDDGFDAFMSVDDNAARFSTDSFPINSNNTHVGATSQTHTAALLDAISSSSAPILSTQSDYEYLDSQALDTLRLDGKCNVWAGSLHWKRSAKARRSAAAEAAAATTKAAAAKKKTPRKKKAKARVLVSLEDKPDLTDIAQKPPKKKTKQKNYQDPLQWTKAVVTKHSKTDHLLPADAGMGVEHLSKLFLLPSAILKGKNFQEEGGEHANNHATKAVGFDMSATQMLDDDGGGSFGGNDDDDGPGFCFADDGDDGDDDEEDFAIAEFEDVRKVDKVHVNFATVAKKVDVKRLKRDLWLELEDRLAALYNKEEDDESSDDENKERETDVISPTKTTTIMSFRDAVDDMESSKSQADVTLPFYFICILHLANEKGLRLESKGLQDFDIHLDGSAQSSGPSY